MPSIPEQISAAAQTQLATQLAVINALSNTAFGGFEKIIALNFNVVKQSLENSAEATRKLLSANGPQDFLSISTAQTQPQLDKILSYNRQLVTISDDTRSQFLQAVSGTSGKTNPTASQTQAPVAVAPVANKTSEPAKAPAAAQVARPTSIETVSAGGNTQLPLLAEAENKTVKLATVPAVASKAATTPAIAKPAALPPAVVKATATPAILQAPTAAPVQAPKATIKPLAPAAAKSVQKPLAVTPEPKQAAPEKKAITRPDLAEKASQKPSFPASPVKQAGKPADKTSAVATATAFTSAKKPVRK
ncbi:MAG: TIGR01841 family phasin [Pseudomonadota bacterium]